MSKNNYKQLLKEYNRYSHSNEAYAIFTVRQFADVAKGKWIEILRTDSEPFMEEHEFSFIKFKVYKKNLYPKYPKNDGSPYYQSLCQAITWEVANEDINNQKYRGYEAPCYIMKLKLDFHNIEFQNLITEAAKVKKEADIMATLPREQHDHEKYMKLVRAEDSLKKQIYTMSCEISGKDRNLKMAYIKRL